MIINKTNSIKFRTVQNSDDNKESVERILFISNYDYSVNVNNKKITEEISNVNKREKFIVVK